MPRRILLIDDDRLQHRLTAAHFGAFHGERFELECAGTYDEGFARLLSGDYAACLLDFQLGERDGLQLIREAAARGCATPIIFLTAESGERVDLAAMEAGALDYLVKGEITPRLLERALRYALRLGATLAELRRLATRDALTGLLNRREFDRILAEETERARRLGQPLGLVLADVDHFKRINDTRGHAAGDVALRVLAERIPAAVRGIDRVARVGGDELGVILPAADAAGALEAARRICAAAADAGFTVSAGAASLAGEQCSADALLAAADRALYAAKEEGRNRAVGWSESPRSAAS
ncbi:MAG: GGDEF domain-containing protein [Opitutaceae bacterium]